MYEKERLDDGQSRDDQKNEDEMLRQQGEAPEHRADSARTGRPIISGDSREQES
jgi:hypothetical protein